MEHIQTILLVIIGIIVSVHAFAYTRTTSLFKTSKVLIDTSSLIDGRITKVAQLGFLQGELLIPASVLRELQYLADKGDTDKRSRARYGLDTVSHLQAISVIKVTILQDGVTGEGGVDERLIELSKKYNAHLLTQDFNLNKVAVAEGIQVLNINQLAQELRMNYLPGEKRHLTLIQKGQDKDQAVGYLEDGTMVVVDNSAKYIGSSVEIEFVRAIQTQAGKMLFAKRVHVATKNNANTNTKNANPNRNKTPTSRKKPQTRSKSSAEERLVDLANS